VEFDNQLGDKDRLYQILVSELQESKMYWSVKLDEKNKELHMHRKNTDAVRDETKRLKAEAERLRERDREREH
jgi:hypothetical protein